MVPARIGVLDALPRTVGGKLDRAALPRLDARPAQRRARPRVGAARAGRSASSRRRSQRRCDRPTRRSRCDDDFFPDLGGDSLGAALLVSRCASDPATAALDRARRLRGAHRRGARRARAAAWPRSPRTAVSPPPLAGRAAPRRWRQRPCRRRWLAGELALGSRARLPGAVVRAVPWLDARVGLAVLAAGCAPSRRGRCAGAAATPVARAGLAVVAKRLLIGRYRPGARAGLGQLPRAALDRRHVLARSCPVGRCSRARSCDQRRAARARRAHRPRVHIHRGVDLRAAAGTCSTIGDDVTLGQDAALRLVELDDGQLVVGAGDARRRRDARRRAPVSGPGRRDRRRGASWDRCRSLRGGRACPTASAGTACRRRAAGLHAAGADAARRVGSAPWRTRAAHRCGARGGRAVLWLPALVAALGVLAAAGLRRRAIATGGCGRRRPGSLTGVGLGRARARASRCSLTLLGSRRCALRVLGRVPPGVHQPLRSWTCVRVVLKTGLLEPAGDWLSGTLLLARVAARWPACASARDCEISTIIDVVPELVEIGDECFLADGIYLGGAAAPSRARSRWRRTRLGARHLPRQPRRDPGRSSAARRRAARRLHGGRPARDAARAASWFGHPPFELPRREVVARDRRLTHDPAPSATLNRVFWELRALRAAGAAGAGWRCVAGSRGRSRARRAADAGAARSRRRAGGDRRRRPRLCRASCWRSSGCCSAACGPGEHALWSCWCSRWDFLYVVWGVYGRARARGARGHAVLPWYLRAMGMPHRPPRRARRGLRAGRRPRHARRSRTTPPCTRCSRRTASRTACSRSTACTSAPAPTVGRGAVLLYGADIGAGAARRAAQRGHEARDAGRAHHLRRRAGRGRRPRLTPTRRHRSPPGNLWRAASVCDICLRHIWHQLMIAN